MNRRTIFTLTGMTLLGLAIGALPQAGFAQSDPFLGTWQLNLAKSKYSPGPAPKSQTVNIQAEGQGHKFTITTADPAGKTATSVVMRTYDGMPHPVAGNPDYDTEAATRADPYTVIISRMKGGKLVETISNIVSADGRTRTFTDTGVDATGRFNDVAVSEKQ
jgi:hypothetical protein